MDAGNLTDTSVAAVRHGMVDLEAERTLVGIVRDPSPAELSVVDENRPALAPPPELLESIRAAETDLTMRGICAEEAHNAAREQVGFEAAYRSHLSASEAARSALEELQARLAGGESLALVCHENAAKKRSHASVVRNRLENG